MLWDNSIGGKSDDWAFSTYSTSDGGQAIADAISLTASDAAGGVTLVAGSGGFLADCTAGAISLDAQLASNFTVTAAADLTLSSTLGAYCAILPTIWRPVTSVLSSERLCA